MVEDICKQNVQSLKYQRCLFLVSSRHCVILFDNAPLGEVCIATTKTAGLLSPSLESLFVPLLCDEKREISTDSHSLNLPKAFCF
jgi:hypothetical protein